MDWKGKRVLVTGGSGMIGSVLVKRLIENGAEVTNLSRSVVGENSIQVNISLFSELQQALRGKQFEAVYHLAAAGINPLKDKDISLELVNIEGTRNLLTVLEELEPCPVSIAGSWTEYGLIPGGVMNENDECNPASPYGKSKLAATRLACDWAKKNNRPLTVLRLFSVYGKGEGKHRLGPRVYAALKAGRPPELSNADFKRDFVYISDVVEAFVRSAQLKESGLILNVGTGQAVSLIEFLNLFQRYLKINIEPVLGECTPRPWDVPSAQADLTISRDMLNWIPDIPLSEGLEKAIRDY